MSSSGLVCGEKKQNSLQSYTEQPLRTLPKVILIVNHDQIEIVPNSFFLLCRSNKQQFASKFSAQKCSKLKWKTRCNMADVECSLGYTYFSFYFSFYFSGILCDSPIVMQCAHLHGCVYVPLSVSWRPLWGNCRSRWNAADISFGAMNKSIKQHTHRHMHRQ